MATKPQQARSEADTEAELERLRALVRAYETEMTELRARTARLVAQAEERGYWLDVIGLTPERLRGSRLARLVARLLEGLRSARGRARRREEP